MYTIRDLCKISKLSRSTILYYDSLGLLKPAERNESNYRLYTDESFKTLERICLYRDDGVTLEDIGMLLSISKNDDKKLDILERTLFRLNEVVQKVQKKQSMVVEMIKATTNTSGFGDIFDDQYLTDSYNRISAFAFDVSKVTGFNIGEYD